MSTPSIDSDIRHTFWKAFSSSPFIMMKLEGAHSYAEPLTALLDKEAHHAIWFFVKRDNRVADCGKAHGQVMTKGHDVFASISGSLVEESDHALRQKHWNNAVEAWFPNGENDPSVLMLRFDIEDGEVWTSDMSLKGTFKLLAGKPLHDGESGKHALGAV